VPCFVVAVDIDLVPNHCHPLEFWTLQIGLIRSRLKFRKGKFRH
jgi:hypothetical protein